MNQVNPILVELTRGSEVESIHRGAAVVVDGRGQMVSTWGDVDRVIYPRSSVKPLQAVPLVASGAARALGVTEAELALACASHGGEPEHTTTVRRWLDRLGCGVEALECGAHAPSDPHARRTLARAGETASALHNNCSGKHAGFLTLCRHLGFPSKGYIDVGHPVQELVRDTLAGLTGSELAEAPRGIDGCGIPVYGIPLRGLAGAMTKFSGPAEPGADTDEAFAAIRRAMVTHPHMVAGTDRFCTVVMEALAPNIVVKTGAEGVYCAAVVDRGLGIALKIDDGATRASEVAIGGILRAVGAIDDSRFTRLRTKLEPDILNVAGRKVGVVRASSTIVDSRF